MKFSKLIVFTVISSVIIDVFRYLSWVEALSLDYSTFISAFLKYISIFIISYNFIIQSKKNKIPVPVRNVFVLWMLFSLLSVFRGFALISDYRDWKNFLLISIPFTILFLAFYVGSNLHYIRKIFVFYSKYIFVFGFGLIPLTLISNPQLYSRIMIPVSIYIVLLPFIKHRIWKFLIIGVALVSVFMVIGFRANLFKITFSFLLLIIFYFRNFISLKVIRAANVIIFLFPIVFVFLSLFGGVNLLEKISENESILIERNDGKQENLAYDNRTFLYIDVLSSMNSPFELFVGKSIAGSYKSKFFYDTGGAVKGKRYHSEVGILNIFLYHGLIGVVLYFLLLFKVSMLAINNSSNMLSKMLGLMIASRWLLSFVEEYTQFDLNFYFFFLILGLLSTNIFRNMNDSEIIRFINVR